MARDGVRRSRSSVAAPISKTSPDKGSPGPSSSQASDAPAKPAIEAGHPLFAAFAEQLVHLHRIKNQGYAGGGPPLGNFERCAKIMALYKGFPYDSPEGALMHFFIKHFDAAMWGLCKRGAAPDESVRDMAVYALIMLCMNVDTRRASWFKPV